jgi:hypothetical protein
MADIDRQTGGEQQRRQENVDEGVVEKTDLAQAAGNRRAETGDTEVQ